MAITDTEIDLTLDNKFGTVRYPWYYASAKDKLFGSKRLKTSGDLTRSTILPVPRHIFLPWNSRKISKLNDNDWKLQRMNNDTISEEFGATIRTTETNSIMVFAKQKDYSGALLEEFFLETLGVIPYTNIGKCFRCNKVQIKPYKNYWSFGLCPSCALPRLPWEYTYRRIW